eukprot:5256694-Ditylum_brightwellii.AAC.1
MRITGQGYLQAPDDMWKKELSKDEQSFVVTFNKKVRYNEDTSNLGVPTKFENVLSSFVADSG